MVTTALVVEILVAGLLAIGWLVVIPGLLFFPEETKALSRSVVDEGSSSLLLGLAVLSLAYPLGWLVNAVTSGVALVTYRTPLQRRIFGHRCTSEIYRELRVMLLMSPQCAAVNRSLEADTAVQRIARSAGLSFSLIGLFLVGGTSAWPIGVIALVSSFVFWWIAVYYHVAAYKKIRCAVTRLPEGRELLGIASGTPEPVVEASVASLADLPSLSPGHEPDGADPAEPRPD